MVLLRRCFLLLVITMTILSGCGDNDDDKTQDTSKTIEVTNGEIKLSITAEQTELSVADTLKVVSVIEAPEGTIVNSIDVEKKTDEFSVLRIGKKKQTILPNGKVRIEQEFELAPFLPGDINLPPFALKIGKNDSNILRSKAIKIKINSVFKDKAKEKMEGIAPPMIYPKSFLVWYILFAVLLVVIIAVAIWYFKYRKTEEVIIVKTPYEEAMEKIVALRERNLLARGEVKLFYSEVSDILRWFVEAEFNLRAPELTTEEFMLELQHSSALPAESKVKLRSFLEHCDMVKFAAFQPTEQEIENTFNLCEEFIRQSQKSKEIDN